MRTQTRKKLCDGIWDHGDEGGVLKASVCGKSGDHSAGKEELAGYSSKRLVREIEKHEYQLSLEPVIVKTTFEKASEESTEGGDNCSGEHGRCLKAGNRDYG